VRRYASTRSEARTSRCCPIRRVPSADVNRHARTTLPESPPSAWGAADLWDREYAELCAIPSSYRMTPSHAFGRLEPMLRPLAGSTVLDVGCGTGRHSLYLARLGCSVHAVDSSSTACEVLRDRAASLGNLACGLTVEHAQFDVCDVPDSRYDIIIDAYVSCHLLDDDLRRRFLNSLRRLLRRGGALFTACMGSRDEYYAARTTGPSPAVSTDPLNGVTKLLQPQQTFRAGLEEFSRVQATTAEYFNDTVADQTYRREVLAAVLRA